MDVLNIAKYNKLESIESGDRTTITHIYHDPLRTAFLLLTVSNLAPADDLNPTYLPEITITTSEPMAEMPNKLAEHYKTIHDWLSTPQS